MPQLAQELIDKIESLPELEKLWLVDLILNQLDQSDPAIDKVWAEESRKRWQAYKDGRLGSLPYAEVMERYRVR